MEASISARSPQSIPPQGYGLEKGEWELAPGTPRPKRSATRGLTTKLCTHQCTGCLTPCVSLKYVFAGTKTKQMKGGRTRAVCTRCRCPPHPQVPSPNFGSLRYNTWLKSLRIFFFFIKRIWNYQRWSHLAVTGTAEG